LSPSDRALRASPCTTTTAAQSSTSTSKFLRRHSWPLITKKVSLTGVPASHGAWRPSATWATAHGFRSSFRDWCSEKGYPRDLAERALAHTLQN